MITKEFVDGGVRWKCPCGRHGDTMKLASGQISAVLRRVTDLGDAHERRAHTSIAASSKPRVLKDQAFDDSDELDGTPRSMEEFVARGRMEVGG